MTTDSPLPATPLPTSCDVLVVGAGPAGSACAQALARAGLQVLLVDQHIFPRDKICGDGLIPDTHAALQRMGVADEVAAAATPVAHVQFVGPRGGYCNVPGALSVLPRKTLDHILVRAAQRAGATLLAPLRFEAPLLEGQGATERVVGARFKNLDKTSNQPTHEIRARWVVLATGAVPQALLAAGLCDRHTPSGVALRGYVHNPALVGQITELRMVWHPKLRGGYGWIFPAPGGMFNIGAGYTGSHHKSEESGKGRMQDDMNLRQLFDAFCAFYPPAAAVMQGTPQGDFKGAPLRCSLVGARWSRPGLLATGEAIGSTYAMSGEGIGKAMETGMLAADALLQQRQALAGAAASSGAGVQAADAAVQQFYAAAMQALKPKFDLYETASRVNRHPWLADLVIWRANRSPRILRRLAGVLDETQNPGYLFSWRGVRKLMFE